MSQLVVRPAQTALVGSVPVPCDRRMAQNALLLGALSAGPCRLTGVSLLSRTEPLAFALRACGVAIDMATTELTVQGRGLFGLQQPEAAQLLANDAYGAALLLAALSAQGWACRVELGSGVDERLTAALNGRGARFTVDGRTVGVAPALEPRLFPIEVDVTSGEVPLKAALLLSGLFASGPTLVREALVSADHLERLLQWLRIPVEVIGAATRVHPPADPLAIEAFSSDVPGDFSATAVLLAGAQMVEGSAVTVRRSGLNPTRTGALDALRLFGATVGIAPQGELLGEPVGEVTAQFSSLRSVSLGGELMLRARDDLAAICAVAARTSGRTELHDLAGVQVADLGALADVLRGFGVPAQAVPGGLVIEGRGSARLRAAEPFRPGSPAAATLAVLLALRADGPCTIQGAECLAAEFPRFAGTLRALGAHIEVTT